MLSKEGILELEAGGEYEDVCRGEKGEKQLQAWDSAGYT